jgi:hypothetical protein
MEITNALRYSCPSKVDFAVILLKTNEVRILTHEWPAEPWEYDEVALKDVQYKIFDSVFYIKGTQRFHYKFSHICEPIDIFSERSLYKIRHKYDDKLVVPFVEQDLIIKRWWGKPKTVKGIDLTDQEVMKWYLSKEEIPVEFAISNFTLKEL